MIKIDFHPGTHGHFLEYVSNIYIMQTLAGSADIFNDITGSAHCMDSEYNQNRMIYQGHWSDPSYTDLKLDSNDTVIQITVNTSDDMFFIMYTNLLHRGGDIGLEKQLENIDSDIRANNTAYRNQIYSKFNEREKYSNYFNILPVISNKLFEFPIESFFSFNFLQCKKLNELAFFLDQTFFPNESLYRLWCTFIEKNQGWNSHLKCNNIIEHIFANRSFEFKCTILEEGWLNYNIAKFCRMYNGAIFDSDDYPLNTRDIYNIIQNHLTGLRYE